MEDMEAKKASEASRKEKSPGFCLSNNSGMNRWKKAAEQDCTMAMVFVIINALKAVFLIRTGEPECGPSCMKPPGMVIPAVKVTVAMSVSTTIWCWDVLVMTETNRSLQDL
nr:hypothetical protein CFP56_79022 [Quercus suber]